MEPHFGFVKGENDILLPQIYNLRLGFVNVIQGLQEQLFSHFKEATTFIIR